MYFNYNSLQLNKYLSQDEIDFFKNENIELLDFKGTISYMDKQNQQISRKHVVQYQKDFLKVLNSIFIYQEVRSSKFVQ